MAVWLIAEAGAFDEPALMVLTSCCSTAQVNGSGCSTSHGYHGVTVGTDCPSLVGAGPSPANMTAGRQLFTFSRQQLPTEREYVPTLLCPRGATCSVVWSLTSGGRVVESRRTMASGMSSDDIQPVSIADIVSRASITGPDQPVCGVSEDLMNDETYLGYSDDVEVELDDDDDGDDEDSDSRGSGVANGDFSVITVHELRMIDPDDSAVLLASGRPLRQPVFGLVFDRTASGQIAAGVVLLVLAVAGVCVFFARAVAGPPPVEVHKRRPKATGGATALAGSGTAGGAASGGGDSEYKSSAAQDNRI